MGGKAIKTVTLRRLPADQYAAIIPAVLASVAAIVGERKLAVIDAYRTKPDFGDMDVLVEAEGLPADYRERIAEAFGSKEVGVRADNDPVTSFERAGFQIDIIEVPRASFDFAACYLAYNDLGNLLGRVARGMGLKLGHHGLFYPIKDAQGAMKDVLVTRRFSEALRILGYRAEEFQRGFNTMKDVFQFAASTPFFNPNLFRPDEHNSTARRRFAKRTTYAAFIEWMDSAQGPRPPGNGSFFKLYPEPSWIDSLHRRVHGFTERLEDALAPPVVVDNRIERFKELFNGAVVSTISGLTGKPLGELLDHVRARAGSPDAFVEQVLSGGVSGVREMVEESYWILHPQHPFGQQSDDAGGAAPSRERQS